MTAANTTDPSDARKSPASRALPSLHILALSSLAFAQPLLDLLRQNPEFFVARDLGPLEITILLTSLLFVLPLPLLALEAAAAVVGERARALVHRGLIWALFALVALPFLKRSPLLDAGSVTILLAAIVALLATWSCERLRPARMLLDYLSIAPLLVALLFLLDPRILRVLGQSREGPVALPATGASAPIVFVILDELAVNGLLAAPDEINRHRYPNFARLVSESIWFENAATVSSQTVRAVPAILSGRIPDPALLATAEDHPLNLFTFFGGDYDIWAHENVTRLCPPELNQRLVDEESEGRLGLLFFDLALVWEHVVLPSAYTAQLPPVNDNWENFRRATAQAVPSHRTRERLGGLSHFESFLDSFTADAERTLRFVHLSLPHHPWVYLPNGKEYRDDTARIPGLDQKNTWGSDEWYPTDAYRRYLLQLEMVDGLIGRLVRRMKDLGIYEQSLITVVSDHGVSFRPEERIRRISLTNMKDILPMLMLIKKPYQSEAQIVRTPVLGIDLFPTILDVLGVDAPSELDGHSALDPSFEPGLPRAYFRALRGQGFEDGLITRRPPNHPDFAEHDYVHAELHHAKHEMLDWKLRVFGKRTAPSDIFRVGTRPELHGRSTADLAIEEAPERTVFVKDADLYADIDLQAALSPVRILGTVSDLADDSCSDLAIAVNGRIEATTRTSHRGSRCNRFSALVPESALRSGANTLEVLVVTTKDDRLVLRRPQRNDDRDNISLAADGTLATLWIEGALVEVVSAPNLLGNATDMRAHGEDVVLRGRVWDRSYELQPETVLLFRGTDLVASAPVKDPRRRRIEGEPVRRPHFKMQLQETEVTLIDGRELRLVVLSTDSEAAWEIPLRRALRGFERRQEVARRRAQEAGTAK